MFLFILWSAVIAALFYYVFVKPYDFWKKKGVPEYKPRWVVGDYWPVLSGKQSFIEFLQSIYYKNPGARYTGVYEFLKPILLIRDPDLLKQLSVKDFDHFTDHRNFFRDTADPLWSKNLFGLSGEKWRNIRATLSPSFTAAKMKGIFVLIHECAEDFVKYFLEKDEDVVALEMKDTYTRLTNDVIATTAFGIRVDSLREPNNQFYLTGRSMTNFSGFWTKLRIFGSFIFPRLYAKLNIGMFSSDIRDFFVGLINESIKEREEKGIVRPDMVHLMMEARKGVQKQDDGTTVDPGFATVQESEAVRGKASQDISNVDIASQAMVFFFAGFDTVSTVLSLTSHELAVNPDIQDRLREEILSTLKQCNGKLTYDGLSRMKYLDMVISESLRKWPPGLAQDRMCTKAYTIQPTLPEEKPVHLEPGTNLWFPNYPLHHDPEYFPDPDRFDPERFNDENKGKIKPYTYFPFGLGPRNCIGSRFALVEIKTAIFHILLNFQLVPVEKTQIPLKISKNSFSVTCEGGFWLGLKRIKR